MSSPLRQRPTRRAAIRRRRAVAGAALLLVTAVVVVTALPGSRSAMRIPPTRAGAPASNGEPPAGPLHPADSADYLDLAKRGISDSRRHWWNPEHAWYNDRLDDHDQYPLGTIWTLFGLFEAIEGVAIAEPTPAHQDAVRSFASVAETYYNRSMGGYGPYQGSHTYGDEIWFDDNAWWGLAFVDAYRATHDARYLGDASLALDFIDTKGWDSAKQRMGWSTRKPDSGSNLETIGGAAALAAELYRYTGRAQYGASARRYIRAMDAHATPNGKNDWLFGSKDEPPLTYTEGTMIGAELAMCHRGYAHGCVEAWSLGTHSYKHWKAGGRYYKPPADTILFRYLLQLATDRYAAKVASRAHVRVTPMAMYGWARRAAADAFRKSRVGDLYLNFWDGTPASAHRDGYRRYRYGQLMVHGAAVGLFAWLGAVPRLGATP